MFRTPDVSHVGTAVAPKPRPESDDAWSQEGFRRTPDVTPDGDRKAAAINFAEGPTGDLPIVHGTGETATHLQTTERLVDRLTELGKRFDSAASPNRGHGSREGKGTAAHLRMPTTRDLIDPLPPGPRGRRGRRSWRKRPAAVTAGPSRDPPAEDAAPAVPVPSSAGPRLAGEPGGAAAPPPATASGWRSRTSRTRPRVGGAGARRRGRVERARPFEWWRPSVATIVATGGGTQSEPPLATAA